MNVLLIGSGGREHALAWAISASPLLGHFYCAPGNPGIGEIAELVALDVKDHTAVIDFCRMAQIAFVVVGPEAPLVAGLADDLKLAGIKVFGPSKAAAQLEGSKGFTKDICARFGIPTAAYGRFTSREAALAYLKQHPAPIVIKADGLAAGKGVTVAMSDREAREAVEAIFEGRFGAAECVIEDYLEGEEASFFALCDGINAVQLGTAQDHKRVGDNDTGPNTGGMGAYSPAPVMTAELCNEAFERIIVPTVRALNEMGMPYVGVLYAGLMITASGPKLIEYNVRFGDPETQVLMMRLKDDILTLMLAACDGTLDRISVRWHADTALTVVMAAKGYPGDVVKGSAIRGLDSARSQEGVEIFHAGTALRGDQLVASGGRVLNITALGATPQQAQRRAYAAVDAIDWPEGSAAAILGGERLHGMVDANALACRLGPWLVQAAAQHRKMRDLHSAYCTYLREAGVPLWRSSLALELLHPELTGAQVIWTAGDIQIQNRTRRDVDESGAYQNSPVRIADETNRTYRRKLDTPAPDMPLLEELREAGATDYAIIPFPFIDKTRSAVVSYATQVPEGFSDNDLTALEMATAQFSPYAERNVLRTIAVDLLNTYLGRRTGEKVFEGAIERGGAEIIPAAILMADLRGFTRYSDEQSIQTILDTLNEFFDALVGPIEENGGEVLKFIGDGLLAIFPADGRELGPRCCEALAAAREARVRIATLNFERVERELSPLSFGLALHAGDIAYGNIGSRLRLDFTAIGHEVNVTGRLLDLAKQTNNDVLASETFQTLCGQPLVDLGEHPLRDISGVLRVFTLPVSLPLVGRD